MEKQYLKDGKTYKAKFFQKPESLEQSTKLSSVFWGRLVDMPAVLDIIPLSEIKDWQAKDFKYVVIT